MASGTITLTKTGNGNISGRLVWESVSNGTAANTSTVTAQVQLKRPTNEWTAGTWKGSITIGSTTIDVDQFLRIEDEWTTLATTTVTVGHNRDGTGSCYLYAVINGPSDTTMSGTRINGSETVALDTIARFATILSATDFTDEENPTITYSNPLGNSMYELEACISVTGEHADVSYRSIGKNSSSYTFNLTDTERATLQKAAEASNTITLKFVVRSRITAGGERDTDSVKATMTIVNANPTATFSVTDTNSTTVALTGNSNNFIALHSTPQVTLNVTTKKGATIPSKGVEITDGATVWKKNGSFTGVISPLSSGNINYTVTDSRGNQTGGGVVRQFVEYFDPTIKIDSITRDGSGNLTVTASGEAFVGSFGRSTNTRTVYYRYKKSTDQNYSAWAQFSSSEVTWSGNTFTATKRITGLDYTKSYNVHVSITDSLHTGDNRVIARKTGLSTIPIFAWGEKDFCFHVPVDMSNNRITNLPSPSTDNEPATVLYLRTCLRDFGLGSTSGAPSVTDLDAATECGWYAISDSCKNAPIPYGAVFVAKRYTDDVVQILVNTRHTGNLGDRIVCIRSRNGSTWSTWEYLNPPNKLAVEYPTVERHDGKVVYTKLVSLGNLPNSTYMNMKYTEASNVKVVSFEVFAARISDGMTQSFPLVSDSGAVHAKARASGTHVYVYSFADLSGYTGMAKIKYTKG